MKIDYDFTPADLFELSKALAARRKEHKVNVALFSAVGLLFIGADLIYAFITGTLDPSDSWFLVHLLVRLLIYFVLIGAIFASATLVGRKAGEVAAGDLPNGVFCRHMMLLEEDGFWEVTDVNASFQLWSGVESVTQDERFIMIGIRAAYVHAVPKKSLSEGQAQEFFNTATRYFAASQDRFVPSQLDSDLWLKRTGFHPERSITNGSD